MPDSLEFQSRGESGPPLSAFGDRMVPEKEQMFFRPQTGSVPHGPSPPRPAPMTRRGWVMNHSTWDLEVHAREMQRRWLREADRARQVEAARQRGDGVRIPATRFSISRLMTAFRDCLSPRRSSIDGASAAPVVEARFLPIPVPESRLSPDVPSVALSQPYAGMVVLARGTSAQTAAQPCAAGDC